MIPCAVNNLLNGWQELSVRPSVFVIRLCHVKLEAIRAVEYAKCNTMEDAPNGYGGVVNARPAPG